MKKDKVFTAIVGIFALAFLAGVGFCVKEFLAISSTKASIEKTEKSLKRLVNRGNEPALTEENLAVGKSNAQKLAAAKTQKIAAVKGKKASQLEPKTGAEAGDFSSSLLSDVNERAKKMQSEKIVLDSDAKSFGFSRYAGTQTKPVSEALPLLGMEQKVVQLLTDRLVAARKKYEADLRSNNLLAPDKRVFLWIKGIRREAAELPKKDGAVNALVNKDELSVAPTETSAESGLYRLIYTGNSRGTTFPSLRKPNAVDAVAFQVGFVAPTAVLRDFIAAFSGKGEYPVFVRDVAVSPVSNGDIEARKAELNPPPVVESAPEASAPAADAFDIFGGAPAESNASAALPAVPEVPPTSVVSPESLSEFWVTLEYVSPVENPVPAEEKEEE